MIYRPLYVEKILAYQDAPFVKILTGMRRCGKSTLLKMLAEKLKEQGVPSERILQYSFDSLEHAQIHTAKRLFAEIQRHLAAGKTYIFLDEIQNVHSWEKAVNALLVGHDVDIYATGSHSQMLAPEISAHLAGRYVCIPIYPLSFAECLAFRKTFAPPQDPHAELANYLRLGGFPAVHLRRYSPEEAYTMVRDICYSTIFTEVMRRGKIRKAHALERILRFAFAHVGEAISVSGKGLKSETDAVRCEKAYRYLAKLESAYILNRCPRYDLQAKKPLKAQEKFYLADSALRYSVLGYTPDSVFPMLENAVYLELLRRGYTVSTGKLEHGEIDFVATKRENKLYKWRRNLAPLKRKSVHTGGFWIFGTIIPNTCCAPTITRAAITRECKFSMPPTFSSATHTNFHVKRAFRRSKQNRFLWPGLNSRFLSQLPKIPFPCLVA